MSNSKNRAAQNVNRFSSQTPSGVGFARKCKKSNQAVNEVDADGFLVNPTPIEVVEPEDEYSRMARQIASETEARRALQNHPLVVEYGFLVGDLIGQDPAQLDTVVQACESARVLGREETCKILRIEDRGQTLFSIGMQVGLVHLVLASGALKARLAEIEIEHKKKEEKKLSNSIPRRQSAAPALREIQAAPNEKPEGSDAFGRITFPDGSLGYTCVCGCDVRMMEGQAFVPSFPIMQARQNDERISVADLWAHALTKRCAYTKTWAGERVAFFPLLTTRAQIEKTDAEYARRQALQRAEQERRDSVRRQAEARRIKEKRMTEGIGKTAGERAKHPNESWRNRPEASQARSEARTARSLDQLGSLFGDLPGDRKVA